MDTLRGREITHQMISHPYVCGKRSQRVHLKQQTGSDLAPDGIIWTMVRERWAFQQLRIHRIFDEQTGDVFEPPHQR